MPSSLSRQRQDPHLSSSRRAASKSPEEDEEPDQNRTAWVRFPQAGRALLIVSAVLCGLFLSVPAHAIPAFAEQTGLTCAACHEGFPQLNDFGRMFKMNGYVLGGSIPSWKNFAATVQLGFTHLNQGVPGGAAPGYPDNNDFAMQQASVFYGGALYAPIGLGGIIQYTYDGVNHVWTWDDTDIRLAQTVRVFGGPLLLGMTANNAPTVADPWNTLSAQGYPFVTSSFGFGSGDFVPYVATLAQAVWGGGPYFDYHDWLYGEADVYRSLSNNESAILDSQPTGISFPTAAWYGRLALHHTFGPSSFEIGMFGLTADPYPQGPIRGFGTDQITNFGVDAMYQWISGVNAVTVNAAYTHEQDSWYGSSSPALPTGALTSNPADYADYFNANVQYLWNQKIGAIVGYFANSGSPDQTLYGTVNGKPSTRGYSLELDYYPFNNGGPKFFPWMNVKLFAINTFYTLFDGAPSNYDGTGRTAANNDTFLLGAWLAF